MQFQKESLQFLKDLKKNNNRDWFTKNKSTYATAHKNAKDFWQAIKANLEAHDEIEKIKMFRIYRDVRFSHDKTPYQPHFAGSFSRFGKALRGGYYLRIRPGESFLAGGFWQPEKEDLFRIRKEFEVDVEEINEIVKNPNFIKYFGGKLEGEEVKTAPKGFQKDHPNIEWIRKKGFIAMRKFTDKEVLSDTFLDEIDHSFKALRPFFDYMSDVLTTNLNGETII